MFQDISIFKKLTQGDIIVRISGSANAQKDISNFFSFFCFYMSAF